MLKCAPSAFLLTFFCFSIYGMAPIGELMLKLADFQLSLLYNWEYYQWSDKQSTFVGMPFHIR